MYFVIHTVCVKCSLCVKVPALHSSHHHSFCMHFLCEDEKRQELDSEERVSISNEYSSLLWVLDYSTSRALQGAETDISPAKDEQYLAWHLRCQDVLGQPCHHSMFCSCSGKKLNSSLGQKNTAWDHCSSKGISRNSLDNWEPSRRSQHSPLAVLQLVSCIPSEYSKNQLLNFDSVLVQTF